MSNLRNEYKGGDIPFQDYPRTYDAIYSRRSFGKILSIGTACALIATHEFPMVAFDEAAILRNVDAIEQYEATINSDIKGFNKVMAAIVDTNEDVRQNLMDQLMSFRSLVQSWDGYGAIPAGARCAASAAIVINGLSNQAIDEMEDFFPNTNGSLSFKWTNALGEKISLSVGSDSFSYYCKRNGMEVELFDGVPVNEITIKKLNEDIQSVMIADV